VVTEQKKRGLLKTAIWIIFVVMVAAFTMGIGLLLFLIPAFSKKNNMRTFAVCQNCGCRWEIKDREYKKIW